LISHFKEEYELKLFQNRILEKISLPKRAGTAGAA
jgi:hypothetical protein